MRFAWSLAAVACLLVLLPGCGQSGVSPEGKLLKNGQPFVPGEGEFVQISFVSVTEGKEGGSYLASFDPTDSSFTLSEDKGIPPGKYRVSVQLMKKHKDLLQGKYGPTTSPFVVDIQTGKEEIKVDLARAGGEPAQKSGAPTRRK
jgi:hypothetical protein